MIAFQCWWEITHSVISNRSKYTQVKSGDQTRHSGYPTIHLNFLWYRTGSNYSLVSLPGVGTQSTHAWRKNVWKGVFFCSRTCNTCFMCRGLKNSIFVEKGVLFKKFQSVSVVNLMGNGVKPLFKGVSWKKLKLVLGVFLKPMFMHMYTNISECFPLVSLYLKLSFSWHKTLLNKSLVKIEA